MKVIALTIAVIALAAGLAACGQSSDMKGMDKKTMPKDGDMKGMDMKGMDMKGMGSGDKTQGTVHNAVGVVKNVDPAKSTVTLAHEPVKSLNWPAMTMDFQVRDKASLAKLKPEQKIEFELVEEKKGSYVISRIK